jgi:co-chaperonin GroES (HSP10)
MQFRPLHDRVVVKRIEAEEKREKNKANVQRGLQSSRAGQGAHLRP